MYILAQNFAVCRQDTVRNSSPPDLTVQDGVFLRLNDKLV